MLKMNIFYLFRIIDVDLFSLFFFSRSVYQNCFVFFNIYNIFPAEKNDRTIGTEWSSERNPVYTSTCAH